MMDLTTLLRYSTTLIKLELPMHLLGVKQLSYPCGLMNSGGITMLSDQLKKARKSAGLTQDSLAKKVKTTKGTISNYENGHSTPSNDMLVQLANALDTTTDYLLGRADSTSSYTQAGISDTDIANLSPYQKEVIEFILSREN